MKKRILSLIIAAALLVTPALAYGEGSSGGVYENRTELLPGFTYANSIYYGQSGERVESYSVTLSPGGAVYPIVLACDTLYGGMTVTEIIAYAESLGYTVLGAVNADFGYWETRSPCGMVVEDGVYKSSPEGNRAIALTGRGVTLYEHPEVSITLGKETGESFSLTHLNQARTDSGLYLYSEYFSTVSTRTRSSGWYVRLRELEEPEAGVEGEAADEAKSGGLTLSGEMKLEVVDVIKGEKSAYIGENCLVLTASDAAGLERVRDSFAVGDIVTLRTDCGDTALAEEKWVSGCGNILVKNGQIYSQDSWYSDILSANPRTLIGVKADGTVIYEVVDGRRSASRGVTLEQAAQDMISRGCVTVLNMDGGGSSVMRVRLPHLGGWTTVNSPSDGTPRSVCSYILFVTDSENQGRLYLKEDGAYILTGSSMSLGAAAGTGSLEAAEVPGSVSFSPSRGTYFSGVYTAPTYAGADAIRLYSPGMSGGGTLHVVDRADELNVKVSGTLIGAESGQTASFSVSAKVSGRPLIMDDSAVSYTVEGDIGEIGGDGVFTASGLPGTEGKITVSAAGLTREYSVRLTSSFADMKGHWAEEYVNSLCSAGIVNGRTETEFAPDEDMSRGDFLLMLYRSAGEPEVPEDTEGFTDVAPDAYYANATRWAKASGIAEGRDDGSLAPDETLSRQEGFTFLYRALALLGVEYEPADEALLSPFPDADKVADWARVPTATLISLGTVEGDLSGLSPEGSLTRAAMSKILSLTLGI